MKIGLFCGIYPIELLESFDCSWEFVNNTNPNGLWEIYTMPAMCEYCKKQIDFLESPFFSEYDAFIMQTHCNAMERLYDTYSFKNNQKRIFLFQNPRDNSGLGRGYYKKQLINMISFLETESGGKYSSDRLKIAIEKSKQRRILFEHIKNMISLGLFEIDIYEKYVSLIKNREINEKKENEIKDFIENINTLIKDECFDGTFNKKVLVIGSVMSNHKYFYILKENNCIAIPIFNNLTPYDSEIIIKENYDDPLDELSEIYINHSRNIRSADNKRYYEFVKYSLEKYHASAVIFLNIKFCTLNVFDADILSSYFKSKNIPFLSVEDSFEKSINAGVVTRISAFLENL